MPPRASIYPWRLKAILPLFAALAFCAFAVWPQSDGTRVDGRITNAGKSLVGVRVVLSHQETFTAYRATTDKYGTFSISDVPRGDYLVSILSAADEVLFRKVLSLTSAPDAPIRLDIDITDEPPKPPPNAASAKAPAEAPAPGSAKDAAFDALTKRYESAVRAGDHQAVIAALKAIVAADPSRWDYFDTLGNAQLSAGDYEGAVQSFGQGVQAAQQFISSTPPGESVITKSDRERAKAGMAEMLLNQGNAFLKLKKNEEAMGAYTRAAEVSSEPATAYFNLCVAHYNARKFDGAVEACDKATAADPQRVDAYFIKGALLFASGQQDKSGKVIAPPGTVEALKKYLELAPQGAQAQSARQMLEYIAAGNSRKPS
jgi:tetratricopeptide (TPR) repeat protein